MGVPLLVRFEGNDHAMLVAVVTFSVGRKMIESVICTCIELEARALTSIRWSFGAGLISVTDQCRLRWRNAA